MVYKIFADGKLVAICEHVEEVDDLMNQHRLRTNGEADVTLEEDADDPGTCIHCGEELTDGHRCAAFRQAITL